MIEFKYSKYYAYINEKWEIYRKKSENARKGYTYTIPLLLVAMKYQTWFLNWCLVQSFYLLIYTQTKRYIRFLRLCINSTINDTCHHKNKTKF